MYTFILLAAVLLLIILLSAVWKVHPVPVLLSAGLVWGLGNGLGLEKSLETLAAGFGKTMQNVGFIIMAGTIIGKFMEKRGALAILADFILRITGQKRVPSALAGIGCAASITIFCDSAFVILNGLAKNLCKKAGIPTAVGIAALGLGLYSSHCMVPPAVGPVGAASILEADFGLAILFGLIVAVTSAAAGRFFAAKIGRTITLEEDVQEAAAESGVPAAGSLHSVVIAALPILVPLLLILTGSLFRFAASDDWKTLHPQITQIVTVSGLPMTALAIGAVLAVFGLGRREPGELAVSGLFGKGIAQAAGILVITSAGGAFGELLRSTPILENSVAAGSGLGAWAIFLPLGTAALLKTAQGSSTVAALTAAGIFAPLLGTIGLDAPAYRALCVTAIGCGSMMVSHANDSYFWVMSQFTGLNVRQGLRLLTLGSLSTGLVSAVMIGLIAQILRFFV